jgi:hypothetical protein
MRRREFTAHAYFLTLYAYRKIELPAYSKKQLIFKIAATLSGWRLRKDTDERIA